MRPERLCFILIVILLLNAAAGAGEKAILTLDGAVERALAKNSQVKASEFALKRAKWEKKHSWTLLMPTLGMSSRMMRIDDRTFAERDFRRYLPDVIRDQIPQTVFQESYYTSLDVTMPLFNGTLLNGLFIANANVESAHRMAKSTRENILFLVISSYLNALRSRELLDLQRDYLELAQLNYAKAERLFNAGRYSNVDVLRWRLEHQQQRSVVVNAESAVRSQMANLQRLVNLTDSHGFEIEDRIPAELLEESVRFSGLSDAEIMTLIQLDDRELIRANAALAAAKSNEEISRLFYRDSYFSYLPNVSVSYSYGWRENNTLALDDYSPQTVMLNVTVPLFSGFQKFTSMKSAYFDYKRSQQEFNDQLQNTRYILTETANKIINNVTQKALSKTNLEYNEHNYRIILQQHDQGLVSNIDLLDAQLDLREAHINDIATQYEFISAIVELYYLLSKLETLL